MEIIWVREGCVAHTLWINWVSTWGKPSRFSHVNKLVLFLFAHLTHLFFDACTFSNFPCSWNGSEPAPLASLSVRERTALKPHPDVANRPGAFIKRGHGFSYLCFYRWMD